jgi:hypothetical protein
MLEMFKQSAGIPCDECASMKLTEAKFIISEYPEHEQKRKRDPQRVLTGAYLDHKLGPEGLVFGPHEFRLGDLSALYSRRETCPFCRLAVDSLLDHYALFEKSHVNEHKSSEELRPEFYSAETYCFVSKYNTVSLAPLLAQYAVQFK